MENKKTTELLDLLWKIEQEDTDHGWNQYSEVYDELLRRTPYSSIIGEHTDNNEPTIQENVAELFGDIKKLKRHKHDTTNGDVLIRL